VSKSFLAGDVDIPLPRDDSCALVLVLVPVLVLSAAVAAARATVIVTVMVAVMAMYGASKVNHTYAYLEGLYAIINEKQVGMQGLATSCW